MRKFLKVRTKPVLLFIFLTIFHQVTKAQQLGIRDFVLFSGSGPVQLNTSTTIAGGSVGSYNLVRTTGNSVFNANIYSGGRVELANSNTVNGNISAANTASAGGNILQVGSNAAITGNSDIKGSAFIGGGFVNGYITTAGLYSGPSPSGGARTSPPTTLMLPTLPALPNSVNFSGGVINISNSADLSPTPGLYGNITLTGNKTVSFLGTGTYVFKSIKNSGNFNNFVFDFQDNPTGIFRLYVEGDVDLYKLNITFLHGGDASRIFMEVHGDGSTVADKVSAWSISNGASGNKRSVWHGTVWAPNGNINVGQGSSESKVVGALWSGKQINVQSGVTITYKPLVDDNVIVPFSPSPLVGKVYNVIGAELTSLLSGTTDEAQKLLNIKHGNVLIEVIALIGKRPQATQYVLDKGMIDTIPNGNNYLIITGWYPIAKLDSLNSATAKLYINFCRPVYKAIRNSGPIVDAGDSAMGSYLVRSGFKYTEGGIVKTIQGKGVKIGVISDSYNTLPNNPAAADTASGELPGSPKNSVNNLPVHVILDNPDPASDEGRAMLQLIHDVAPAAELAFRTGSRSPGDFAIGIKQLQEAGCKVIVDDMTYITEPFLRDGTVAKMVDLVKTLGVSYFTSAGNFGGKSYEKDYNPTTAPSVFPAGTTAHNFGSGIYQRLKLKPGSYVIALQWEDDFYSIGQTSNGGTQNDFDMYLTDLNGNIICGYNRPSLYGDPIEILAFNVLNTVTETEANLLITREGTGTALPRFKYIIFRGNGTIIGQPGASTIIGQANAAGAITVGAVNYFNTPAFNVSPKMAPYSSVGGGIISGNINRNKPDLSAPDGVNTSVNMGPDIAQDADLFSNFFGTSASAPHAAAVAALLIEAWKKYKGQDLSPDNVKIILQSSALKFSTPDSAGAGLVRIDSAIRTFASPTPYITSLQFPDSITAEDPPTQSFTLTVNGDYFTSQSQIYFRDVPVTTTFINNNQLTATITGFIGNPPIKVCNPPKAIGDGGCSNVYLFFSIAKKIVKVVADNKTKKYGEPLPSFSATVTLDGNLVPQTGLEEIGLQNLTFQTNANSLSNVGINYFIKPLRTFNPNNSTDVGLLEKYIYDTIPGTLVITQLPVIVIPNDQTVAYGQPIQPITFTYKMDSAVAANNPQVVNIVRLSHEEFLVPNVVGLVNNLPVAISNATLPVAISNGTQIGFSNGTLPVAISNGEELPLYNPQSVTGFEIGIATVVPYTLSAVELNNLSFFATEKAIANYRELDNDSKVIDIAQQSILEYNENPSLTNMVNTIIPTNAKGILGAEPLSNGTLPVAISNGGLPVAISNQFPIAISNGALPVAISNGSLPVAISNGTLPIAISNSFTQQANRIAVIIDQTDVTEQTGTVIRSLNVITGLGVGVHDIIPGSVLNDNYAISYGKGKLTITSALLTIKANDATRPYGEPNPTFTASYSGFKYGETLQTSDVAGTVTLTTNALTTSAEGMYDINVDISSLRSSNYTFATQKGILTITSNPCLLTHNPSTNFVSTPNPNTATSLWLNIETKISGQLSQKGDYISFTGGSITLNNVVSNPAVSNKPVPNGKIIADLVSEPITSFDSVNNTWITRVPVGFTSTSDIFISGAIIQSSNGFVKKNNANSVLKGIFYSNRSFGDQWSYAMAAYRPQFYYKDISSASVVTSINGTYRAGTPTSQVKNLVAGGSGGGGNNYTGSSSSVENFTACSTGGINALTRISSGKVEIAETENNVMEGLQAIPNPAQNYVQISFVPSVSGQTVVAIYTLTGSLVSQVYKGLTEKGKLYQQKIGLQNLAAGMYILQLNNGGKLSFKKLVVLK